jgi:SAM-dependent MidA family methyltransferase
MPPSPPGRGPQELPPPSADALAHNARVVAHIASAIVAAGGWIPFADYMQAALYAPGLGYYVSGTRKFGADGDFVTAPEMTPLFGSALARQVAEVLARTPGDVIEIGPGTGRLAADLLAALAGRDALPATYRLLEVSPELRARQREHLQRQVPALMPRIEWIDALPERWRGVLVANEVLDAVAPHVVVRRDDAWFERGVALERTRLILADRPLAAGPLLVAARARFPAAGDYMSEINPAAQALVAGLARRCEAGALLLIDYGFPAREYYHPQRSAGTLLAHYRHRALADVLYLPGLADLTAHVDFSAIARSGVAAGMALAGFTSQANFLVNCGVLDLLAQAGDPSSVAYLGSAAAVQKLLSPAEMGELFKVLALTRGSDEILLGFRAGDRSRRLLAT